MSDDALAELVKKYINGPFNFGKQVEFHSKNNTQGFLNYVYSQRIKKTFENEKKKIVYLDTKYWVYFCNYLMGDYTPSGIGDLYNKCKELVEKQKVVFPISTSIFVELEKQCVSETKKQTAKIMSELSNSLSFGEFHNQICEHYMNYLIKKNVITCNLFEKVPVFDNINSILGIPSIEIKDSSFENLELSKTIYDFFDFLSFEDFSSLNMKTKNDLKEDKIKDNILADELTIKKNKIEKLTFSECLKISLKGNFLAYAREIYYAFAKIDCINKNIVFDPNTYTGVDKEACDQCLLQIKNDIDNAQLSPFDLPFIYIISFLDAKKIVDPQAIFQANDAEDFRHAAEALTYSDFFFTEKKLGNTLRKGPNNIASIFKTVVCVSPEECLNVLSQI